MPLGHWCIFFGEILFESEGCWIVMQRRSVITMKTTCCHSQQHWHVSEHTPEQKQQIPKSTTYGIISFNVYVSHIQGLKTHGNTNPLPRSQGSGKLQRGRDWENREWTGRFGGAKNAPFPVLGGGSLAHLLFRNLPMCIMIAVLFLVRGAERKMPLVFPKKPCCTQVVPIWTFPGECC